MRQLRMLRMVSRSTRRLGWMAAGAAVVMVAAPTAAPMAASGSARSPRARAAAAAGAVYGGFTAQNFPVVIEMNKKRTRVLNAGIGIRMSCTSGGTFTLPDRYQDLKVSKKRRFSSSFSDTNRNDDGTTTDLEGSINGALNKARTKVTGRWTLKATDHDTSGAVTDTCDGGTLSFTAKQ